MAKSVFGFLEEGTGHDNLKVKRGTAAHEAWADAILPADADVDLPEGETSRRPLVGLGIVVMAAMALLVGRLFVLQVLQGNYNLALANGNRVHERVARAPRGMIYDRNNQVLARNQASFDITAIPQLLPAEPAVRRAEYERIAEIIGITPDEVAAKAEITCTKDKRDSCLNTPIPQLVAAGVSRDKALLVDQMAGQLAGFALDVNPVRQYLDNSLLSVFLGYTGRLSADDGTKDQGYGPTDLIGKLGIEKQYELTLRGTNGGERTEVDASGRPIRVLASHDPVPGQNLILSLDFGLQQKMAEAIARQMTASGAKRASGVAVNPNTGEILAAVSLPSYDNNLFSEGISVTDYQKLVADVGQPLFNKVVSGAYPSGSIIKPIGASAALQEAVITPSTTINDTGVLVVPNPYEPDKPSLYHGWERENGLGSVNVLSALSRSSDIFFYVVMGGFTDFLHYLGIDKLADYYKKFGLGSRTGVDIPGETPGRVPTREWKKQLTGEGWYQGDTYNVSVGQGDILTSPLQMVMAVSVIANGGTLYQPRFVGKITDSNGKVVKELESKVVRSGFISPQHLATVRQGMWMAVNDASGTACCKIKEEVPVTVAAKTGTAETVVHDAGVDAKDQSRPHSWFEAFAPFDKPQIAVVVLVEHAGEGSQFAAPATRETLAWYFSQGAGAKR